MRVSTPSLKLKSASSLVRFSSRSVSLLWPYLSRNHRKNRPKTIFGFCSNAAWKLCTMAGSRSAKNLLTSALFIFTVSQKLVCSPSQTAFATCLLRAVSSSAPSQFPGSTGAGGSGYASLVYCAYIYLPVHIDVGGLVLILLSHVFEHTEVGGYLGPWWAPVELAHQQFLQPSEGS